MLSLYNKPNGAKIDILYPTHGTSNILRTVTGRKTASFTGPGGRGITVEETSGKFRRFLESKCVIKN